MTQKTNRQKKTHNNTYPKVAVQWLNKALYLVESEVLRNPPLPQVPNLW
jgi:hypothetical protein